MFSLQAAPKLTEFIPLKEHLSSTPAQFALDEEPVLYYHEDNVDIKILNDKDLSPGLKGVLKNSELFVATTGVSIWNSNRGQGLSVGYTNIVLHAIFNDEDGNGHKSIYIQLMKSSSSSDEEKEQGENLTEIVVCTKDSGALYEALTQCSSMHFDADDGDSEEYTEETTEQLLPTGNIENQTYPDSVEFRVGVNGEADDIPEDQIDGYDSAALEVEVTQSGLTGRRSREPEDIENSDTKWRRIE